MRTLLAVLSWLVFATLACCQSIHLPAALNVATPGLVVITPNDVDGDMIAWVSINPDMQLVPSNLLANSKTAIGVALKPGSYPVRALAAKAVNGSAVLSPWSECIVTVGGTPVPPVPPVPPLPPVPPVPPLPPTPVDVLAKPMADAYTADPSATKAAQKMKIISYYQSAAKICSSYVGPANKMYTALQNEQDRLGVAESDLATTRAIVGHAFQQLLPIDPNASLTAAQGQATADVFTRAAAILGTLP